MTSLPPPSTLRRLVAQIDPSRPSSRAVWVTAPPGYGKSTLLDAVGESARQAGNLVVQASVARAERHLGLFLAEMRRQLREQAPALEFAPLMATADRDTTSEVLSTFVERMGHDLWLLIDDVEALASDDALTRFVLDIAAAPPPGVGVVLAGSERPPSAEGLEGDEIDRRELELSLAEVADYLRVKVGDGAAALADDVWRTTGGWPAMVELVAAGLSRGDVSEGRAFVRDLGGSEQRLVAGAVDRVLSGLRPDVQFVARVSSIFATFDGALAENLLGGEVSGPPEARRRLVRLPANVVREALATLERAQLLRPAGNRWALNPMVRSALRDRFRADDVDGYREAHRRAAVLLLSRGESGVEPLDLLLEAEEYDRLLALVEERAERFLDRGEEPSLLRWLEALDAHFVPAPAWVDYYLGRVYARQGDWERSRERLEKARAVLGAKKGEAAAHWQPRLGLGYAKLYWRRGHISEARTWCQRGIDYVDQALRRGGLSQVVEEDVTLQGARLAALLGRVTTAVGNAQRAKEALEAALKRMGPEDPGRPEVLSDLAVVALREGEREQAEAWIAEGLDLATRRFDDAARAESVANDAVRELLFGDWAVAERRSTEAVELARRSDRGRAVAFAFIARGRVLAARGELENARAAFAEAATCANAVGRADLYGEALEREAVTLVATGRLADAKARHAAATTSTTGFANVDGYLAGLTNETEAELRLFEDRATAQGLKYLDAARETYVRYGAEYDAARLHWRQAEASRGAAASGDSDALDTLLAHLEDACVIADEHGFRIETEEKGAALAQLGFELGDEETKRVCERVLVATSSMPAPSELGAVRGLAKRRGRAGGGTTPFIATDRDGERPLTQEGYDDLLAAPGPCLVALVGEQAILNFGKRVGLAQKRVMFPLLLHILRHPDVHHSMRDLASAVWGTDDFNDAIQTKVKVAVSRLRALLGKARKYILTTRKMEDGESVVAYQLAPGLSFLIVAPRATE